MDINSIFVNLKNLTLSFKKNILDVVFSRRMVVSLLMGFSCGVPLLLTMGVLQAWMKQENIDITKIGLISLVQIPYTWKFLWAPIFDRFIPPFLGRRRGWLIVAQLFLMISIAGLGFADPGRNLWITVLAAILVAFFSASQDIVVDAYRREDLSDNELGLGSSMYIYGYRVGMLLASGGGFILADIISFSNVYLVMALCILPGILTTIFTTEPKILVSVPKNFQEAVIQPLYEYFTRKDALWILAFILFYKIGDAMASTMTTPFYLEIGFSNTEIGAVVKLFGFWATIAGISIGGLLMLKLGIYPSLWIFGLLQAASTACFAVLAHIGYNITLLSAVISFENITSGMGTSAYVAFMASITNKKFTATQYALLTSLMGIPRVLLSAPTGYIAKDIGWENFFIFCTLVAVPGMLLLLKIGYKENSKNIR
ncbi:MAG: AmpG family muropeptide MFS transporter [Desulfobacterales bacterium]|nr:AmpG family muropeptide MFS transporter [Desulfobacterales bacterium]